MKTLTEEGRILLDCADLMARAARNFHCPAHDISVWEARHSLRRAAECAERGKEKNCAGHLRLAAQAMARAAAAIDQPDRDAA